MTHPSNRQHLPPARSAEEYERTIRGLREALAGMQEVVHNSNGVDGWHLNGDTATWDEFEEVQVMEAALARYPQAPEGMLAMMKAMQEQIEWDPLPPDAPEATVFVGGKPMPVSEFIEKYQPEEKP